MPKSAAPKTIARTLARALVHARPEPEAGRASMAQWETDVFSVSLAVQMLGLYEDGRFRTLCQGPKDTGEEPEA